MIEYSFNKEIKSILFKYKYIYNRKNIRNTHHRYEHHNTYYNEALYDYDS